MGAAFGFLVGIVLGSFVKAASERLIDDKSIMGRSRCMSCKHTLTALDLFPVLSYIFLKGHCRYCKKAIPQDLLWTELLMGLAVAIFTYFTPLTTNPQLLIPWLFGLFTITILAIVFLVDLETGLILDKVSYPATVAALVFNFLEALKIQDWSVFINPALTGISIALFFIFLILVTKGRGMGWGDVKFVLFLGVALGFPNAILGIFLAFLIGAVASILLIVFSKKRFGQTIPFGPFLSLGAYIALVWGKVLVDWYLRLI